MVFPKLHKNLCKRLNQELFDLEVAIWLQYRYIQDLETRRPYKEDCVCCNNVDWYDLKSTIYWEKIRLVSQKELLYTKKARLNTLQG